MDAVTYIKKDEYDKFIKSIGATNPCRCCTTPRFIDGKCIDPCTRITFYEELMRIKDDFENRAKENADFSAFLELVKQREEALHMVDKFQKDADAANAEICKVTYINDDFIIVGGTPGMFRKY